MEGVSLLILYGSQTGNALEVAERVEREARRRHYRPRLLPADAYISQVARLPEEAAVVLIVSTTGQGEAPDNFAQLWKFLRRKSLAPGSLGGVAAAVFGLGDSGEAAPAAAPRAMSPSGCAACLCPTTALKSSSSALDGTQAT
jgi:sulfite reductase alpha subunit-like flavoprotein